MRFLSAEKETAFLALSASAAAWALAEAAQAFSTSFAAFIDGESSTGVAMGAAAAASGAKGMRHAELKHLVLVA